jgi:hypothetical protein
MTVSVGQPLTYAGKPAYYLPLWPSLVANVIQAEIVQDQGVPIIPPELVRDMACDVVVHLGEVLLSYSSAFGPFTHHFTL